MKKEKPIKETKLDDVFSWYIRTRDGWRCTYPKCKQGRIQYQPPTNEIQNSHYYTRNARSVRWHEDNCDAVCKHCHPFLEDRKNAEYTDWKREQLGERRFRELRKLYTQTKQWTNKEKEGLYEKYKGYKPEKVIKY